MRTLDFNALANTNNSPTPKTHSNYSINSTSAKNTYELRPRRNIHLPFSTNNSALLLRNPISTTKSSSSISTRL